MANWALVIVCALPVNHLPELTCFLCASKSLSNLDVSHPIGEFHSIFYAQNNQNNTKEINPLDLCISREVKIA